MSVKSPTSTGTQLPAWVDDLILSEALNSARLLLSRGYLHEVNNALAGIGTLAEALKGSTSEGVESSLELISAAANKSTLLERRVRSLYATGEFPSGLLLNEFLPQQRDIMELMLPRRQKFSIELADASAVVSLPASTLWSFISLSLYWASVKASEGLTVRLIRAQEGVALAFELQGACDESEASQTLCGRIESALELLAARHDIGFINSRGALLLALGKHLIK